MSQLIDFKCQYGNAVGIRPEITKKLNLSFPDAYCHWDTMAEIAREIRDYEGASFCTLPFCHTVEGEAMGGIINYGDETAGPRAKEYICSSVEEVLALPEIDYTKGRIAEVLRACRYLREQGEHVVLEISGPFTILNVLMDARHVFRAFRKQPDQAAAMLDRFRKELLRYMEEAQKAGVDMISYADSAGGLNIVGPKLMETVTLQFTKPLLTEAERLLSPRSLILLCPKTTFALLGTGCAEWQDIDISRPMSYGEGCIEAVGKISFVGQQCIKNIGYQLKQGSIKGLKLI